MIDLKTGNRTTYHQPLTDREGVAQWSNAGGIVAFRTEENLKRVHDLVKKFLETNQQHKDRFANQRSVPSEDDN